MKCPDCDAPEHPKWRAHVFKSNGETPLDQPVIPVAPKGVGVDRPERRPALNVEKINKAIKDMVKGQTRERYNAYHRAHMKVWRARKKALKEK